MPIINIEQQSKIFTVSKLNQSARKLLEGHFGLIEVEGEISNLARPASGHIYFRLKDDKAQIQCAFFRNKALRHKMALDNGLKVKAKAMISLYEARGDYQLIIDSITPAGIGDLQKQFEALKAKLQQQGLFDEALKQELPVIPHQVGIITSETAAAFHDIKTTLTRRFKAIPLILYPTEVQGKTASRAIARAIKRANQHKQCDVLILARGGGSLEDLWPFNEEEVALAIHQSKIPIVTGVGHEIDYTIADFCADLRAPTPTAAAEMVVPESEAYLEDIAYKHQWLKQYISQEISQKQLALKNLQLRLKAPSHLIYQSSQRLDILTQKIVHILNHQIAKKRHVLNQCLNKLHQLNPINQLKINQNRLSIIEKKLCMHINKIFNEKREKFIRLITTLEATSPLKTLERGYCLTTDENNQVIFSSKNLQLGQKLWVKLKKDKLHCELIGIEHD